MLLASSKMMFQFTVVSTTKNCIEYVHHLQMILPLEIQVQPLH